MNSRCLNSRRHRTEDLEVWTKLWNLTPLSNVSWETIGTSDQMTHTFSSNLESFCSIRNPFHWQKRISTPIKRSEIAHGTRLVRLLLLLRVIEVIWLCDMWLWMIVMIMITIMMIIITGEDQQAAHSQDHRHLLGRRLDAKSTLWYFVLLKSPLRPMLNNYQMHHYIHITL